MRATNDQGVTAQLFRDLGYPPGDMERAVDAMGFHEFGHLLMRQYFYGMTLATQSFSVRWFEEFLTPDGWANYGWYQGQFADRGRQVFEKQGLAFIARVREELPWERYAEWRAEELLGWLEEIEPGFLAWARSLDRRSTEPPPPLLSGPFYPEGLDAPILARLVDGHLHAHRSRGQTEETPSSGGRNRAPGGRRPPRSNS